MNPVDTIRHKAEEHKIKYQSFDLSAFIRWIERKPLSWQLWATSQDIPALNKGRRFDMYRTIQDSKRNTYTPCSPED